MEGLFCDAHAPGFRGELEIMGLSAWMRASGIHGSCIMRSGPLLERNKREWLGCLSELSDILTLLVKVHHSGMVKRLKRDFSALY